MTDRELLELAAKAAGIRLTFGASGDPYAQNGINTRAWNPLTDDGDALRLAVKLSLLIQCDFGDPRFESVIVCGEYRGDTIKEPKGDDPCAATRRAIVRAAAKVGKTKA